jgi:peptide/nickel transport system substrate-binding protein
LPPVRPAALGNIGTGLQTRQVEDAMKAIGNWSAHVRRGCLAAVPALALLLASGAHAEPKGSVVVATAALSQHADPTVLVSTLDYMVDEMLYDGLINLGAKGKYPGLAQSWTISPDGKQIDFHLRKGVKFHNGDPFSAEDVKFTFEKILAPDSTHSYRRGFQDSIDHVEVVDPLTARFVLKQPWPAFFTTARYALTHIVPKNYYEKVGPKGFQEKPIGTGPFKFVSAKAGEWTKFEANTSYWGQVPHVKFVTEQLVAEPFTRYAMLERGEADIVTGLSGALLDKVRSNKDMRVVMSPYAGTSGILFNKKEFPEAADKRVRLAVAYAINRVAIAKNILGGVCEPASSIITPGTFGYLPGIPLIPYDPAKAKALLKEAGVKPGLKVSFVYHTQAFAALPGAPQVLEAISGNLEAVGFAVERKSVDTDAWMSMMRGGKPAGIFYTPSGTPDDGGELINTWFASNSAWTAKSVQVPEYDQIFKEQQQNPDPEKRKALLQKFSKLEHENFEMVPLLWCSTPYGVSKRVKAWSPALGSGYYLGLNTLELAN